MQKSTELVETDGSVALCKVKIGLPEVKKSSEEELEVSMMVF